MKQAYVPKYFELRELVPQGWYRKYGERLWCVFDERLLMTLDDLREAFGPAIINNWHSGGSFERRGFRPLAGAVGAALSQHRFGRAADITFSRIRADAVRRAILDEPERFPHVTALEMGVSWVHVDVRPHDRERHGIFIFWP